MIVARDGEHEVCVYKCENLDTLSQPLSIIKTDPGVVKSAKELVVIRSLLCSTKLTQNVDIMTLLNWRAHHHDNIPNILQSIMKTGSLLTCFS